MDDVAIVGMACLFPGAPNIRAYWENILNKVDAISDPPDDWEAERYFDADSTANDRIYCKRGGYLGDLARFNPLEYGVMPSSLDGGEPDHFLALKVAKEALIDAGYSENSINPERTEVIVGRGTYINRGVTNAYQHTVIVEQTLEILKELHPEYKDEELQEVKKRLKKGLPPFTAETVPSLVPNVLAGRIANRLNCMGTNYLVDAACASSLIAVEHGMRDLITGRCDMALVGGVNASIPPTLLMIFCQINALSHRQCLRPFDSSSDGTMLGEGLGFVVLKRKGDAERDGNRIYAVLKSVGVASDGRALGLLTPRLEGEVLAIKRAYDTAGVSPQTIELLEAHGTGTPLGDATEVEALKNVYGQRNGSRPSCAFGTVKSMIGHLIPASGMAGLIKTALALYHRVLPPTLCDKPNPDLKLKGTPFYINTEMRPWIHGNRDFPRRAGVNAFGFGGINAHAILEEYTGKNKINFSNLHCNWDTEVFFFTGESRQDLIKELDLINDYLKTNPEVTLKDLAYTLNTRLGDYPYQLTIVAGSGQDLSKKIVHAAERLRDPSCVRIRDRSGIYYFDKPLGRQGKTAFLFPGEGSQYVNMFSDLCLHFPEIRSFFDLVDSAFIHHPRGYLPSFTTFSLPLGQGEGFDNRLWAMDSGAESVFAADQAMLKLMTCLEIKPDVLLGHSTGEYSALLASGMLKIEREEQLIDFILGVNRVYEDIVARGKIPEGILLSVGAAKKEHIESLVEQSPEPLYIAMDNCPNQIVLCGSEKAIVKAEEGLRKNGAILERLPFGRAYHTPLFEAICDPLLNYFRGLKFHSPQIKAYSCVSAQPYPDESDGIRRLATSQWARRVRFIDAIEAIYNEGVRIFIEVGPRGNLTNFVDDILRKKSYLAVPSNLQKCSGITQLNHLVGLLAANHVSLNASFLYRYRKPVKISLDCRAEKPVASDLLRRPVKIDLNLPCLKLKDFPRQSSAGHTEPPPLLNKVGIVGGAEEKPRSKIMLHYLKNMDQFLHSQQEIFKTYLSHKRSQPLTPQYAETNSNRSEESGQTVNRMRPLLPFTREIVSITPGKQAVILCKLSFKEDRFLLDHTLGGVVSDIDKEISGLSVVPLTFSMEIMAEGAALLMEGKKLVGMREVRAYRWIGLDSGKKNLRVDAKTGSVAGEVKVQIMEVDDDVPVGKQDLPIIEGTMIFDNDYAIAPPAMSLSLRGERKSRWTGADLYEGFMFHGPSLRGVASMDLWGEDGALATLRAMPEKDLFTSFPAPAFSSDPVVLDAAGQVIAYWTSDHLEKAYHIFPFRLEALYLYGAGLKEPEAAKCQARINLVDETLVRSDIDIIDPDGKLRMRLLGWWDRRFDQPEKFFRLRVSPKKGMLSTPWLNCSAGTDFPENISCCMLNGISGDFLMAHDRIWMRVMSHLILSRKERALWYNLNGTDKRRTEWLLGRAAAKDAARLYLKKYKGLDPYPADIVIGNDQCGRPVIESINGQKAGSALSLSISHSSGIAFAAAGKGDDGISGIGVDIERLRPLSEGFEQTAFTEEERDILSLRQDSEKNEWFLRFWCAKEAVSKALGSGMMGSPKDITVISADMKTGDIEVGISREIAARISHLPNKRRVVKTLRENNLIIAITYDERGGNGK